MSLPHIYLKKKKSLATLTAGLRVAEPPPWPKWEWFGQPKEKMGGGRRAKPHLSCARIHGWFGHPQG
jgi:hypothetical protein